MNIGAPLQPGVSGIERGLEDVRSAAQNIASPKQAETDNSTEDLAKEQVVLATAEAQVAASAKAVKTTDETLGTLLDVTA